MDNRGPIRSISRCIAVLQAINRNRTMTMMEIARAAGLPYPTTTRIIQTLMHEGLIECERGRKSYRSTALVQTLSQGFDNQDRLVATARPHIVALTSKIGWPVAVTTRVGQSMMVRDSTHDLTSLTFNLYSPGYVVPLLESASGLVYLAHASESERSTILEGLQLLQSRSPLLALFASGESVEQIRRDGYATYERNPHTHNPGKTSSFSVPLFQAGDLVGALTVAFFTSAMPVADALSRYLADVSETAKAIDAALQVVPEAPAFTALADARKLPARRKTPKLESAI